MTVEEKRESHRSLPYHNKINTGVNQRFVVDIFVGSGTLHFAVENEALAKRNSVEDLDLLNTIQ